MKNFIDFIAVAAKDNVISAEFKKQVSEKDNVKLSTWFEEQGYNIPAGECKKLTLNSNSENYLNVGCFY